MSYFFVCSFAITMGPVSWTYPAELVRVAFTSLYPSRLTPSPQFPLKVRGKAVSLSTATNWLFNFALAYAVPPGFKNIAYKTYFIFATFNAAACIHIFFMYPETVGRSLEEVEEIFEQGHVFTAWKIHRGVGKKTVHEVVQKSQALEVSFCLHNLFQRPH